MNRLKLLLCYLFFASIALGQSIPEKLSESDFVIGKTVFFESEILGETRELNIYLPQSYSPADAKVYPVIYLLDGSADEDFIHVAGIVQFGSFPWIQFIPESIVVGIGNIDRKRDFTYPSGNELDQSEFPTSGGSANFMAFIEKELQPFVDTNYKSASPRTLIGQSLGGLLATEILLEKPDLFDNYIIVSPSLWWDDEKILKQEPVKSESKKVIYIAGGKEGEVMERTARALFEKLQSEANPESRVYFEFMEDKTHGDALHIAVYHAFEMMFGEGE